MTAVHFYNERTGVILEHPLVTDSTDANFLEENAPLGHKPIIGVTDPCTQCVEVSTGRLVPYRSPAPDADHVWCSILRRWQLRPELAVKKARVAELEAAMRALDEKLVRPLAEIALKINVADAEAVALRITTEKEQLRAELQELRQ